MRWAISGAPCIPGTVCSAGLELRERDSVGVRYARDAQARTSGAAQHDNADVPDYGPTRRWYAVGLPTTSASGHPSQGSPIRCAATGVGVLATAAEAGAITGKLAELDGEVEVIDVTDEALEAVAEAAPEAPADA